MFLQIISCKIVNMNKKCKIITECEKSIRKKSGVIQKVIEIDK